MELLTALRDLGTARTTFARLAHGRRRVTIDHAPLDGVTPAEVLAWFQGLGGTMTYDGETVSRYLAWHPLDHLDWRLARPAPGGGNAEGARFRIVEQFGGRPEYRIDVTDRVEKLDETGIRLVQRVGGAVVTQLEHTWSAGRGRTHYVSVLDLGARSRGPGSLVNRELGRRFPDDMVRAWVRHNVEEVGRLELLLPMLSAVPA